MRIRADFEKAETVLPTQMHWVPSPMPGVERIMLDRIGEEVARATSLVRYAPRSSFSEHSHPGGEEYLVLEGTFSDQYGDFPAGSYVRNPIGTTHAPHSVGGCTILVKLYQFDADDDAHFAVRPEEMVFEATGTPGVARAQLHAFGDEDVFMLSFAKGADGYWVAGDRSLELYVLEGAARIGETALVTGSWHRAPKGEGAEIIATSGTRIWVKTGHLPDQDQLT